MTPKSGNNLIGQSQPFFTPSQFAGLANCIQRDHADNLVADSEAGLDVSSSEASREARFYWEVVCGVED